MVDNTGLTGEQIFIPLNEPAEAVEREAYGGKRQAAEEAMERALGEGHNLHRHVPAAPEEVVLAAVAIALTLCKNKTIDEIQTLINLFSTTNSLLDTILKQRLINKTFELPILGIELSDG